MSHYAKSYQQLEKLFKHEGITYDKPGFYDDLKFISLEEKDNNFLNCYASFVKQRPRSKEYNDKVKSKITNICEILHNELVIEGRLGACVDMSLALSRILEAEGIWNYIVKGSLTIFFPKHLRIKPQYFWAIDETPLPGHVWVSAPPFNVIDLTLKQQPYSSERMKKKLPDYVLLDSITPVSPTAVDICSPEIRINSPKNINLHFDVDPNLKQFFSIFPANKKFINQVQMHYIPCAITAPDRPLEEIKNQKWNGRYAFEIYSEMIKGKI